MKPLLLGGLLAISSVLVTNAATSEVYGQLDVFESASSGWYTEATPLLARPQVSFYRRGDTTMAFTVDYRVEGPICAFEPADGSKIIQIGTVAFAAGEQEKNVVWISALSRRNRPPSTFVS